MKRPALLAIQSALLLTTLSQLADSAGWACKPCAEPTLAGLLRKADVVAVAQVLKVEVTPKRTDPQAAQSDPLRAVRWQVQVLRGLKGTTPQNLTVTDSDAPPCITAHVPQPGRYIMLLYHRDANYYPLTYCDNPLFEIDAQDRVALPPAMAQEVTASAEAVTLKRLTDFVTTALRPALPPPT